MPLKIFHTADLHLGLTHGKHPSDIAAKLAEARFETLSRMIEIAGRERCQLFVMGGDMFDTTRVSKKIIQRAAEILSSFEGQVLVLPGNHDYVTGDPDDLWKTFRDRAGDRVKVLDRPEVTQLPELDACFYPAPCQQRHSKDPVMGWIARADRPEGMRFHVGLAHGSFEGLSPDLAGEHFPMKREALLACGLDLWLMGHIHLQYPQSPGTLDRIYYPGTPEPDGFDCRHEGTAWIIELDDDKTPHAKRVSTGNFRFLREELKIGSWEELESRLTRYQDPAYQKVLMELKVSGILPRKEFERIPSELRKLMGQFLSLGTDYEDLEVRLTAEEIRSEFPEGSFALQLLTQLSQNPDDHDALQLAYQLIRSLKAEGAET